MATTSEILTYQPVALTFGTSGLRDLVTDMTDLECYINAQGFMRFLQQTEDLPAGSTVYLAGDLRHSTPRIMRAVGQALHDAGYKTVNCGFIPTPAVSYYAIVNNAPCIMVTGSHIPDDRNGIKFVKPKGEVLKEDELAIYEAVAAVRAEVYGRPAGDFTPTGELVSPRELTAEDSAAAEAYKNRYLDVFAHDSLAGKKVVLYQHSSVGRDMFAELLEALGATVVPVGRSETFISIDSENVTPKDRAYFKQLAVEHPDAFAIVSADGDADRPFVVDETGVFHRGDVLGAVTAGWLGADFAAYPVSASDAVDDHLTSRGIKWQHTKIGSPYVVVAMDEALRAGCKNVIGWEVNGGVLTGSDTEMNGKTLKALPTRDAFLPIYAALVQAARAKKSISQLFGELPQRFSQAGLLDNFPPVTYKAILAKYLPDTPETRAELGAYFTAENGFGTITQINGLDGVRMYFDNGDVAHIRLSSNAPQLRMYSLANTQKRADEIVALAVDDTNGIFRKIQQDITK